MSYGAGLKHDLREAAVVWWRHVTARGFTQDRPNTVDGLQFSQSVHLAWALRSASLCISHLSSSLMPQSNCPHLCCCLYWWISISSCKLNPALTQLAWAGSPANQGCRKPSSVEPEAVFVLLSLSLFLHLWQSYNMCQADKPDAVIFSFYFQLWPPSISMWAVNV